MAQVVRLMGIELREYEKDGQKKQFAGLHVCYVEDSIESVLGSKCENFSCPRGVNPGTLELGKLYELDYEIYDTKNGKAARLVGMIPVAE